MNCNNCTNNNALKEVKIKHVQGNVLRMAIPLTLRTIELVDGEINATDTPFIPSSEHPVKVVFSKKGSVSVALDATMKDGNIAYIEEKGKIPVGTYAITVTCNDGNGNPYRFKQNAVLYVADATIEAGIEETIEYEVTTWYLDAAIFLALKGEDGVGIDDIETQSSGEIGGVNTVTFILTDGRTRSFNVLNGSGAVDSDLDINSPSPIANSAVTAKFNELAGELADLFGDVDYDSSSKTIRFWDKGKTNVLASLDARPFIKDGMVSNAYISNNTLVITFNTDSGKEAIGVPLTTVFNPNNYYTKTQVDSRIASAVANINLSNYYTKSQVDNKLIGLMAKEDFVYEGSVKLKYGPAPEIVLSHIEGVSMVEESHSRLFGTSNGHIKGYVGAVGGELFDYGLAPLGLVFLDKTSGLFYRWNVTEWQQVGGSDSGSGGYEPPVGGIPKSDLAQSVQDTLDDVSNKVDKVAGKGLSTEDYTTAEKQKLAGLSNYDDTEIQAEVDAKYEKPSTGIPKTDLAPAVQTSLNKADTALQSSDLDGYATTDDVDDAVAALVSSAPQTLDTLKELADALGDDPNFATTMATQLGNKVDKETGKGLSTNDYTTAEKTKLAGLENYDDSALQTAIDGKVDKETGKSLMSDAEHTKLAGIAAGAEVNVQPNWTQTNTSADDYIKNKPDLSTFATKTELAGKQGVIDDLDAIRSGAGLGSTSVQPNDLANVATSGSYNDLADKPTIPAEQIQSNWNQTSTTAKDYIKNKPTLATVATSGSYNDLLNKPTIPAAYDDTTLSGRVSALENAGFITTETDPNVPDWAKQQTKPTYTAQEVGALPATTTIPTKTSDLTNDSGFIDKAMYYGESTTAAATMPKVCTVETFPTYTNNGVTHAKEGTIIAVKFTNSDTNTTAAPELNVNSIGAKAIMYNNAIVTSTAKNTTVAGTAKMLAYYRYDPALDEGNGAWEFLAKSVDSNSTYSNASLGQGYGTQTNSSATTAITSSISSYALSSGGIVTIKFTYDVPANATLNINSKGAKAIYNQGAAITAGVIKAGDTATFVYSTYYHLIAVDSWQDKQDAISDLATIRSGAAAGASALQSYTETDPTVPAWAKQQTKPTYTAQEVGAIPTVISTTYANLVTTRTNSQLIAGAWYRINNYTCTTTQTDTRSAGHQFDILVQATSPNTLSEEAKAIRHEGDTYFANANLEAWKIWYCLDNDTTRFAWADATNGKGVIYRMIDEWGNDCPYDFKNIQFKRYKITATTKTDTWLVSKYMAATTYMDGHTIDANDFVWCYTFNGYYASWNQDDEHIDFDNLGSDAVDLSKFNYSSFYDENSGSQGCARNVIPYHIDSDSMSQPRISLNNIVMYGWVTDVSTLPSDYEDLYGDLIFQMMSTPYSNTFGDSCNHITFGDGCNSNKFGDGCNYITFGSGCNSNKFGNGCNGNAFGYGCSYNTFGNSCKSNTFGNGYNSNTFGNSCYHNTFGNYCQYSIFGNNNQSNTFGNSCQSNTFGNNNLSNTFGNSCQSNTFGNNCTYNTFGNNCTYNTFGNNCTYNTFGNDCYSNTLGNECGNNTFSKSYTQYVIVENGNKKITLTSSQTPTSSRPLRNITIAQGVNNTDTTKTISHNTLNDTLRTTYVATNSVEVQV